MVLIAYPTVSVRDEKTRDALDVFDTVVTGGGSAGGRFHEELRGAQLVYYVFGTQMSGFAPGYFVFLAQTTPDRLTEVTKRIRDGVDKSAAKEFPLTSSRKRKPN